MKRKHALVIGGTRGAGRAVVKLFAGKGYILSVIGRRQPAESDVHAPDVHYWVVDLLDQDRLANALAEIVHKNGKLDSVVFCQRFRGQDDPWTGDFNTSLTATKQIVEAVADWFDDAGDKSIVMIGSIASTFIATEQPVGYHVAKAGLIQMVRYFAVTLGPRGIRVNAVSPGSFLKEESRHFYLQNKELLDLYQRITPLGRMGTAEEVAATAEFLCGPSSSFITGQDLVVDGGLSLQGQESLARSLVNLNHLPVTRQTPQTTNP